MEKLHNTKKITVRFPKRLRIEMQIALIQAGYGFRGKSKWLAEALYVFLQQSNFIDCVDNGTVLNQAELTEIEAFYVDPRMLQALKNALMKVRTTYPLLEGVQSAIIRAAVVYKLMLK